MARFKSIAFGLIFSAAFAHGQCTGLNTPVANGGTGACTAAQALSNLGAASAASGVPSGMIAFIDSGTCPSGWTEDDALATYNVLVTTSAAGDVGQHAALSLTAAAQSFTGAADTTSAVSAGTPAGNNSGGSFSEGAISWPVGVPTNASGAFTEGAIAWPTGGSSVPVFSGTGGTTGATTGGTPAGTVASPTFTGTAATLTNTKFVVSAGTTAAVETIAGSSTTYTPLGTNSAPAFTGSALATHTHSFTPAGTVAWPTPVPTIAAGAFTQPTISWPAGVPSISAGTFTQPTFAGSALGTHTHTVTPTGTNSTSTVTGNTAYYKVIACKKN